jgi:hypothetical protein
MKRDRFGSRNRAKQEKRNSFQQQTRESKQPRIAKLSLQHCAGKQPLLSPKHSRRIILLILGVFSLFHLHFQMSFILLIPHILLDEMNSNCSPNPFHIEPVYLPGILIRLPAKNGQSFGTQRSEMFCPAINSLGKPKPRPHISKFRVHVL